MSRPPARPVADATDAPLPPAVGRSGFFTLAVGAMVGSGWVVVVGDWLAAAGPAGAVVGFLAGAATMICIALCYGELAGRFGQAGGEFLYVLRTFGPRSAFLVGWFLTLFAVAVCAFEAVVVGSLFRSLWPAAAGPVLYSVGGTGIDVASLVLGLGGALAFARLHIRGARSAIRFQNVVTYGFIALILIVVLAGLALGRPHNLTPLFRGRNGGSWAAGSLSVFAMCAFFLNGWQTALHALEERRPDVSVRSALRAIIAGIATASLIYAGIILATASAVPWPTLIHTDMPVRAAFDALSPGIPLGAVILGAAIVSVAKTWSAMVWIGSRLIVAQARVGFLPPALARLDSRSGAPRRAIWVVTGLSLLGPMCGRGIVLPIVNMVSICIALSIFVCLAVLVRLRRTEVTASSYQVPGGVITIAVAFIAALLMVGVGLLGPFVENPGHIPLEWRLLFGWGALGWLVHRGTRNSAPH